MKPERNTNHDSYNILSQSIGEETETKDSVLWTELLELWETYPDGIILIDPKDTILHANAKSREILPTIQHGSKATIPIRTGVVAIASTYYWLEVKRLLTSSRNSRVLILKEMEAEYDDIERRLFEDKLTGLPNLEILRQFLEFNVTKAQKHQKNTALLLIDVDEFNKINRQLGRATGDAVLQQVAQRLQSTVRSSDVLGRYKNDEFLLILTELTSRNPEPGDECVTERASAVAKRVLEELQTPFDLHSTHEPLCVSCSIGISLCPQDSSTVDEFLQHAREAVSVAKKSGGNRYQFFAQGR